MLKNHTTVKMSTTVKMYLKPYITIQDVIYTYSHTIIWLSSFFDIVHFIYGNINSTWLTKVVNHQVPLKYVSLLYNVRSSNISQGFLFF